MTSPPARRPRLFVAALLLASAAAEACSLFIPFDDYPGPPVSAAEAGSDATLDAGSDAEASDDAEGGAAACKGVDLRNDPANCGACGRQCAADGGCTNGRCPIETVFEAGSPVAAIAVAKYFDGGAGPLVYFVDRSGVLGRWLTVEQTTETLPEAGATGSELYVSPSGVGFGYFARDSAIASFRTGNFQRRPDTVATTASGLGPIAVDGAFVFWGDSTGLWWRTASTDGGPVTAGDASPPPVAMALSSDTLFWAANDGTVREMQALNPIPSAVTLDQSDPIGAVSALGASRRQKTYLYLCRPGLGLVFFEQDVTAAKPLGTLPMDDCEAIAVTSTNVYAVNFGRADQPGHGELWRTALDGTERILLATDLTTTRALDVFGDYVYFASGNAIARTSR